jgi:Skp family chaperone for outer membrane proteins
LVLSIVGALISIGKSIAGFFNHEYRKSQQRRSADDNLERIKKSIQKELTENLRDVCRPIESGVRKIKAELLKSVDSVKLVNDILFKAESQFTKLANEVRKNGEKETGFGNA